jgi:dihydroorotate dehydrogenase (fumarate)
MERKGFASVDDVRGLLSVAPDADEDAHERRSYVGALRNANSSAYGPW